MNNLRQELCPQYQGRASIFAVTRCTIIFRVESYGKVLRQAKWRSAKFNEEVETKYNGLTCCFSYSRSCGSRSSPCKCVMTDKETMLSQRLKDLLPGPSASMGLCYRGLPCGWVLGWLGTLSLAHRSWFSASSSSTGLDGM